jgi:hypothetical protein
MFKGSSISRPIAAAIVWALFLVFMGLPFINDFCISKLRHKHSQRLIWQ